MEKQEIINELLRIKKEYSQAGGQDKNSMERNSYMVKCITEAVRIIKCADRM